MLKYGEVDPTLVIFESMLTDDIKKDASLWSKILNLTKMMYEAGVPITTGFDIPNFFLEPGVSLHRELELSTSWHSSPRGDKNCYQKQRK